MSILIGSTYRAKRPTAAAHGVFDDRRVLSVTTHLVRYDSPTGINTVSREDFINWMARDVTNQTPVNGWAPYTRVIK